MKTFTTFLKTTGLVLAVFAVTLMSPQVVDFGQSGSTAFAQQNANLQQNRVVKTRPKQSSAPPVTQPFFNVYEKIQEAMEEEDYLEAIKYMDRVVKSRSYNSYEKALARHLKGQMYFEQEDIAGAIREFEAVLATPNFPYAMGDNIQFTIGQFYTMEGNYEKALEIMIDWMQYQAILKPSQWTAIAQSYYQVGFKNIKTDKARAVDYYRKAIPYIETAISIATANPETEVRENWYELQYVLYYELGDHARVRDILELMIVKWPRPRYWVQLSVMYSELEEDEKQMAVMDVAYRLGFLNSETNLVSIAQLYLVNSPYLSAKVLELGMDDDCETACIDNEKAKNHKLLGQAHLNSKDYAKAGDPLSVAAADEDTGELWFQLGIVYMQLENWAKAENAFQEALEKGDLRQEGQTYLWLGTALFNQEEFKKAENSFKNAKKFKEVRKNANGWIVYIGAEKARLKRLAAAGLRP